MNKTNNLRAYLRDLYEGIVSKKPDASRNPQNFRSEIEAIRTGGEFYEVMDASELPLDAPDGSLAIVEVEGGTGGGGGTVEEYDGTVIIEKAESVETWTLGELPLDVANTILNFEFEGSFTYDGTTYSYKASQMFFGLNNATTLGGGYYLTELTPSLEGFTPPEILDCYNGGWAFDGINTITITKSYGEDVRAFLDTYGTKVVII